MKILHLNYDHLKNPWIGGGGAVRVYEINRRLSERHNITVISGKYPDARDYTEGNLRFVFLGHDKNYLLSTFCYAVHVFRFLKKHAYEYDLIVEDFAPWNPVFSNTIKGIPVVIQRQSYFGREILRKYGPLGLPFWYLERVYPGFFKNMIIVDNKVLRERCLPSQNTAVISNGIDARYLDMPVCEGDYVLYLGRIDIFIKGLDVLVKAIRKIGRKARVVIAGDGNDKVKFLEMIKGIQGIEYAGLVKGKEKEKLIQNSIFVVLPSRTEGQALVPLEAAAMGKAVIASDIASLRYIQDNNIGITFSNGNADDLAEKILFLLENKTARAEMGKRARQQAEVYTWDRISEKYETFLLGLTH